jgi:hypothetical protein
MQNKEKNCKIPPVTWVTAMSLRYYAEIIAIEHEMFPEKRWWHLINSARGIAVSDAYNLGDRIESYIIEARGSDVERDGWDIADVERDILRIYDRTNGSNNGKPRSTKSAPAVTNGRAEPNDDEKPGRGYLAVRNGRGKVRFNRKTGQMTLSK